MSDSTGTDSTGTDTVAGVPAGFRVVSGSPSPEELAAVVAVLQAQAEAQAEAGRNAIEQSPRAAWDVSARGLRRPMAHGRGAWQHALR